MDSTAVKQAVMQQVVSESNLANARVLIEVRCPQALRLSSMMELAHG
jgi:hypothetical protein